MHSKTHLSAYAPGMMKLAEYELKSQSSLGQYVIFTTSPDIISSYTKRQTAAEKSSGRPKLCLSIVIFTKNNAKICEKVWPSAL